jgi:hypothetical protein
MKTIKAKLAIFGLFLAMATVKAQTTWNIDISDVGGGNSLVTWNVSGTLATPPGVAWLGPGSSIAISAVAPGIYSSTYAADGTLQSLSTTSDWSYFQYGATTIYEPIVAYSTDTVAGNGNQSFSLVAPLPPRSEAEVVLYIPVIQSALIPVDFSDFNPGTYQSVETGVFSTPVTVNLTVEAVPEPGTLALVAGAVLSFAFVGRRLKK